MKKIHSTYCFNTPILFLAVFFLFMSCDFTRRIKTPLYVFGHPSERYVGTCAGEIYSHFPGKNTHPSFRLNLPSEVFKMSRMETGKDGCVDRLVYGLTPGGQQKVFTYLKTKYNAKAPTHKEFLLFKDGSMFIRSDLSAKSWRVYQWVR